MMTDKMYNNVFVIVTSSMYYPDDIPKEIFTNRNNRFYTYPKKGGDGKAFKNLSNAIKVISEYKKIKR